MPKQPILNKAQAEAAYTAMRALKQAGAKMKATFGNTAVEGVNVFETEQGEIQVVSIYKFGVQDSELHKTQDAFAYAYGLDSVAP